MFITKLFPLFRLLLWGFSADGDEDTHGGGSDKKEKSFNQDDVNRMTGKARDEGRTTAEKELLKKFGVQSLDDLSGIVQAAKDADDKSKTDIEKLQASLRDQTTEFETLKNESSKEIAKLKGLILNGAIKTLASQEVKDKEGKVIRPAFRADALDDVVLLIDKTNITEADDGTYSGIDKALAQLSESKAYLIEKSDKPTQKGTPVTDESKLRQRTSRKEPQAQVSQTIRF